MGSCALFESALRDADPNDTVRCIESLKALGMIPET